MEQQEEAQEAGPVECVGIAWVHGRWYNRKTKETIRETQEEVTIGVHRFETTPAQVTRGYGLTLNLKDYESARVDVRVTLPCYVEDLDECDEFAKGWIEQRIRAEVANIRGASDKSLDGPGY
jgi:hypothetical protein